jgi:hypothetical protein
VGIDPTGGTDPYGPGVQWGTAYVVYNGYCQELVCETVAEGDTVTVFLRNKTLWGFKHNDAYWDSVKLETIIAPPPPPPPPPPYESVMLVLPQDATPEQLHEVFTLAFPARRTFGFSHDDAGHLNGTAILYNIPDDEIDDYIDFYAARYPSVSLQFAYTSDWVEPPPPPSGLLLWQCDPEWKDEKVAGPDCAKTLCQTGCWISDCAMAQRYYDIEPDATPSTANQALGAVGGFSGCMTLWSGMQEALGLEVVKRSYDNVEAQEWLDTGNVLFAEVSPEDFTHFVLVTRYQEGRFWMLDPWKDIEGWVDEYYPDPGVDSWRLIRPFVAPPPPPPPPVQGSLVSLHLQSSVEGALDFVERVKPSVVKVFQLEVAKEIKARSSSTLVVLRYFTENQDLSGDLLAAARAYVDSFKDSLTVNAEWIDYVESWNETIATNDPDGTRRAVEFDYWFAEELMALGLPVAPQLLNVAVGNPYHTSLLKRLLRRLRLGRLVSTTSSPSLGPPMKQSLPAAPLAVSEIELMLPAVEQAIKYNGTIGYHAYGQAVAPDGDLNNNWEFYAGRALENWDPVFRAHGLFPTYLFGECGAFATCSDGWRAPNCLNGDWPRYLSQLTEFSDRIKSWNSRHDNRCLGGTLFTSGGWGWDSFEIREPQMSDPDWPV